MAISTFDELKTAITTWLERTDDSVFVAALPDFIAAAEAEINRMLRHPRMMATSTLSTDASGEATLPTDFLEVISAYWDSATDVELLPVGVNQLARLNPASESGTPCNFMITGTTFKTIPAGNGSVELTYYAKITALSDSDTTNWLLTLAPDAYLYMCLKHADLHSPDSNWQQWDALGKAALNEVQGMGVLSTYRNAAIVNTGTVI